LANYPQPNPVVRLMQGLWLLFLAAVTVFVIVVLVQMLDAAWWWELPILAVFVFAAFVLLRNRRRGRRPAN
jgi:membrane protein implicated in regulation of membrane protease activity